ncbi:Helix-turn-helix domain-containing protein [Actinacidiphila alni]|uniref:Helix-turn-helix domain-containing protein n=1 Tax=Actinacidiphila alni TaxID=380248 RepID=A0A1I2C6A4_9ACTN|nr:helix-turn-helix transcriptional regulator [Actinacidiphila alni]SFE63834.1 Helix-turn-helix domain-containing protein [Actinacidiphila alni]
MNRPELAAFLRRGRARLTPADVGLAEGARRRTPGLRREEVARLAGMSADYYARLEQGRAPRPSRHMLAALARALRLPAADRDRLFLLSGEEPPREHRDSGHIRPGLLLVLDRLHDTPAQVVDDLGGVLARNTMADALLGDLSGLPPARRNVLRLLFTDDATRALFPARDRERLARGHVARLRAALADRPDDPRPAALAAEMRAADALFTRLWDEAGSAEQGPDAVRVLHPVVGELALDREELSGAGHDQRLIVYSAPPGGDAYERLRLLRVVGLQDLTTA